jgi:CHRD domain
MDSLLTARRCQRLSQALLIGLAFGVAAAANAADTFKVRLRPVPIEASTATATTGMGAATATLDGTKLTLTGEFTGLKGAATVAHLHEGPVTGVRGPAIADVTVPAAQSGKISAELALTPVQAESVRRGRVYVEIASVSAPDGNLWGWLLP